MRMWGLALRLGNLVIQRSYNHHVVTGSPGYRGVAVSRDVVKDIDQS